ncbi:MAG TPA: hypothetical protein VM118_00420 [Acidobacteriota bacterium]|nr:hypothetical protein [Acidobacteriota bacterium]
MATFETWGATTGSSAGTTVSAGDDVKGSYTQLIASTGIAADYVYVFVQMSGSAICSYLVDIATGAASSEVVVVPDLYIDHYTSDKVWAYGPYRLDIASGTRISARAEGTFVSGTEQLDILVVAATAYTPDLTSPALTTDGDITGATDKGTLVDPGGTAHTKGSWVQLSSAAPATAEHFWINLGQNLSGALGTCNWLIDVAIGAAASETVHIENTYAASYAFTDVITPLVIGPFPADGMQSQRVALRAQCSITDATNRLLRCTVTYGTGTPVTGGGAASGVRNPLRGPI